MTRPLALALLLTAFPLATHAAEPAGAPPKTEAAASATAKAAPLRVASWGGAYGAAISEIVLKPFTNRTGIEIVEVPYTGGIELFTAPADAAPSKSPAPALSPFDVVDFTGEDAAAACAAGHLSEIDPSTFAAGADETPAASDFALGLPCAVASSLASEVLVYRKSVSAARVPQRVTDLFDLATFPGKRGLKRDAQGTLELALLADGVAPKDVYSVLATQEGIARAFAKLDSIKKDIVWWEKGDMPTTLVGRGDIVMSIAYNTRAYAAMVSGAEIGAVWDSALVYANGWGVLKSAPDQKAALEFVKFATDSARLAQIGEAMPYGPARRSALQAISPEMRAASPSAPEHLEKALVIDAAFWAKNGLGLRNRFDFWLKESAKPAREASLSGAPSNAQSAAAPAKTQP
jgi:putative spermidine/putrescine transport system substrate-binding protein